MTDILIAYRCHACAREWTRRSEAADHPMTARTLMAALVAAWCPDCGTDDPDVASIVFTKLPEPTLERTTP